MIAQLLFWLSVFALFHSYVLYPLLLQWLMRLRKPRETPETGQSRLPFVSIIIAAFNEEKVLEAKLNSVFLSDYPADKMEVLVGSDASTDQTNAILQNFSRQNPLLQAFIFEKRRGKGPVINELATKVKGEILIFTDANVMFSRSTITGLVQWFAAPLTGLVDSNMKHTGIQSSGISLQENAYISREVKIKYAEGILWGAMMGPFGGCFAIRKELFSPVPDKFLVDDFYMNMQILEKGFRALSNPDSIVYEDVSNSLGAEMRRKIRIATGNFQNLARFRALLWPPWSGTGFAFLSHKVLRWTGPFFLLTAFFSSLSLFHLGFVYRWAFWVQLILLLLPGIDFLLRKINIHVVILRFLSHFYSMNLAMLAGFYKYIKGVNTNVWQPTQRNQSQ